MKSSPGSIKLMATEKRHVAGSVLTAASQAELSSHCLEKPASRGQVTRVLPAARQAER